MRKKTIGLLLVLLLTVAVTPAEEDNVTRVIIDADTANEVDDLYAIVRALIAPEMQIEGLSSTHWRSGDPDRGVKKSQALNEQLLDFLDLRDKISHPEGADRPMPDRTTPVESPAAHHIIERAHAGSADNKLLVVALGTATNLASALLLDPEIEDKVIFAFIDGDYRDGEWGPGIYNWPIDIHALQAIFDSNVEYYHMPAPTVSGDMILTKSEVDEHLKGAGGVWDFLVERWETHPYARDRDEWIMWDIALIQALLRPDEAYEERAPAPRIISEDEVEQRPGNSRMVTVFYDINVDSMREDFWQAIADYRQRQARGMH